MSMQINLKPGSAAASIAGCTCPTIDNHHGAGCRGDGVSYITDSECPLHRQDDRESNRVLICLKCGYAATLLQDGHCGKCCQQMARDKYMAEIRRIAVLMGSTIEASMQLPDDFLRYYEDGKTPAEAWMEEATCS